MCLDKLLTKEEFDALAVDYEPMIAYKVVDKVRAVDQTLYYRSPFFPDFRMTSDVWVGYDFILLTSSSLGERYEAGIHLFLNKKDAFAYSRLVRIGVLVWPTVVKVEYARPVAYGYQNNRLSIVAKEVKVLCEEEQDDRAKSRYRPR
jgi:hypothetical protein